MHVAFDLELEWYSGGENVRSGDLQPLTPWWLPTKYAASGEEEAQLPYILLPYHLCSEAIPGQSPTSLASEVLPRRGWHCLSCGKLNAQHSLCYQQCSCGVRT